MAATGRKLTAAVEDYFAELRRIRATGGDAVMPGQGRAVERDYTTTEREARGDAVAVLGGATVDVYLNDNARWSNVPAAVWNYKLGSYQVLKK